MRTAKEIQEELNLVNKKANALRKELKEAKINEKSLFDSYPDYMKIGEIVKDKIFYIQYNGVYGSNEPYNMSKRCANDIIDYYKMKKPVVVRGEDDTFSASYVIFDIDLLTEEKIDIFSNGRYKESSLWSFEDKIYWFVANDDEKDEEYINYKPAFDAMYNNISANGDYILVQPYEGYLECNQKLWVKRFMEGLKLKPAKKFLK